MPTLNVEAILERVQELKRESEEKDEVIGTQQRQILELESKIEQLELQISEMSETASKAESLIEKLDQLLR
jgi:hypothetical protein